MSTATSPTAIGTSAPRGGTSAKTNVSAETPSEKAKSTSRACRRTDVLRRAVSR